MKNHFKSIECFYNIYDFLIFAFCVISIVFAITDIKKGLSPTQVYVDYAIYAIFVIDYIVRFVLAKNKRSFFKENVFDLIAIIPLNSAFRAFRLLRFAKFLKLLKFTKFLRVGAFFARLLKKSSRLFDTNGLKYVLLLTAAAVAAGAIGAMYFEKMSFTDSLWWAFVTATTVGYGDLSPATNAGRLIAAGLMIVGIGLISSLTSSVTSFFLRQESHEPVSEKVEMALSVYELLSYDEKKMFSQKIAKNK